MRAEINSPARSFMRPSITGLNPDGEVGGRLDVTHVRDFVVSYEGGRTQDGYTTGRFSTTIEAAKVIRDDPIRFFVGLGPGSMLKSRFTGAGLDRTGEGATPWTRAYERYGILYGVSGLAWLMLQTGVPGVLSWLAFYSWLCIADLPQFLYRIVTSLSTRHSVIRNVS